jgi:uncharacterized protein (DUF305 family)
VKHGDDASTAQPKSEHMAGKHYGRLLAMTVLSFAAMFVLMYAMVDTASNALPNLNQFYMAGLMTAAMVVIELALMGAMYRNAKANVLIVVGAVVALTLCFVFIRRQTAIADRQFLKSMIPHHAGAILMCKRAAIRDADIQRLCQDIRRGQQAEIDLMKAKLQELR